MSKANQKTPVYIQIMGEFRFGINLDGVLTWQVLSGSMMELVCFFAVHYGTPIALCQAASKIKETNEAVLAAHIEELNQDLSDIICGGPLILKTQEGFQLNPDLPFEIDAIAFKALCEDTFNAQGSTISRRQTGKQALALYRGTFMAGSIKQKWAYQLSDFYKTLYIQTFWQVIEFYKNAGDRREVEELCHRTLVLFPWDEALSNQIAALNQEKFENDIAIIETRATAERTGGITICSYSTFKHIYNLFLNLLPILPEKTYLAVLKATDANGDIPHISLLDEQMEHLLHCFFPLLHINDVVSRYTLSKYALLITQKNDDHCMALLEKAIATYHTLYPSSGICLRYTFKELGKDLR